MSKPRRIGMPLGLALGLLSPGLGIGLAHADPASPPHCGDPTGFFASPDSPIALVLDYSLAADQETSPGRASWNSGPALPVVVHRAGRSRRLLCARSPLKIEFSTADHGPLAGTAGKKFKLVTECRGVLAPSADQAAARLLREFAAYRWMERWTEPAYRVRLARVTYRNAADPMPVTEWAFLLESDANLARRCGAEELPELSELSPSDYDSLVDAEQTHDLAAAEGLLGNRDYFFRYLNNVKAFRFTDGRVRLAPYDFDMADLVSRPEPAAPIAAPRSEPAARKIRDSLPALRAWSAASPLSAADRDSLARWLDRIAEQVAEAPASP